MTAEEINKTLHLNSSRFVCKSCGCIDDKSLTILWSKKASNFKGVYELDGLCSVCLPATYHDGTPTGFGKWHNRFPRVKHCTKSAINHVIEKTKKSWSIT